MAAKPSRAKMAEKTLLRQELNEKLAEKAALALEQDFNPIDDVRATAQYRMLVAKNLLVKFFKEQNHE
jgi:xanthine dehydrogenase small subunit